MPVTKSTQRHTPTNGLKLRPKDIEVEKHSNPHINVFDIYHLAKSIKYTAQHYQSFKVKESSLERGLLGLAGARSVHLNSGWSVERWVMLERGALM